jgi:hypothetical protein
LRYPSALLGKIFERPGPKSVTPARNCSGVAVVVWWRWIVAVACSLIGIRFSHSLLVSAAPASGHRVGAALLREELLALS